MTRSRGKAATSTCIWNTQKRSLPWAFQTTGRNAPNPFWTPAVERCAIRWNPAQHRPHYPACRPPTSACGSKSKLHALASSTSSCCSCRLRRLVSMPRRHWRLHHDRRPARARRRHHGRGLSSGPRHRRGRDRHPVIAVCNAVFTPRYLPLGQLPVAALLSLL